MKKTIILITVIAFLSSCHIGRYVTRLNANITDHKIFPYTEIQTSQNKYKFNSSQNTKLNIKANGNEISLDSYLRQTSTVSFLVIKRDSIIFENYYKDYKPDDISNIFSASKSVTSLLVGIAIDEGKIQSIKDPITKYIPELKEADPKFEKLTIKDLLNMRSGLRFKEAYLNPFAHVARLYYGKNQMKQIKKLKFKTEPGAEHNYQSISTTILGIVVERATNMQLGKYLEEKIWQPLGMEFDATWSVDDKKNRSTKAFCCLNTTARDLAKIGRLYLHNGNWNGQQIINEDWINRSKKANMDNDCYQYQWYSQSGIGYKNSKELVYKDSIGARQGAVDNGFKSFYIDKKSVNSSDWHIHYCSQDFYALGILGQYLYVNPKNEIIIVRLGEKWDSNYEKIFSQIIKQIENES